MIMERIYVTKLFLTGNLKGLAIKDSVTGSDAGRLAKFWHVGREYRECGTGSRVRIVDASFQNYAR